MRGECDESDESGWCTRKEVPETATRRRASCASALLRVGDAALRGLHSNQRTRWQRYCAPNTAAFIVKKPEWQIEAEREAQGGKKPSNPRAAGGRSMAVRGAGGAMAKAEMAMAGLQTAKPKQLTDAERNEKLAAKYEQQLARLNELLPEGQRPRKRPIPCSLSMTAARLKSTMLCGSRQRRHGMT